MADRIEWSTEEPQPARTVRHWLVRCNTGDAITSLATGSDVAAWLNAAPYAVRYYVLNSALDDSAYATVSRDAEEWKARADSALSRSTELQSQRDAIATELRSVAAALGLSTDDTIESLAARCRTAVALGSIGKLRRRAEAAEHELAELRKSTESVAEFNAMREERDSAIRDRDNVESERDVATSELALARESIRNLEEEINAEVARRVLSEDALRDCVHERDRLQRERDQVKRELDAIPGLLKIGRPLSVHASETELAPGSRWEGDILRSSNGSDLRFAVHGGVASLELAPDREDGRWCKVSDTIAVLRRAGMLHDAGVPRERVRRMLIKAVDLASPSWLTAMSLEVVRTSIADRILADYDREKGDRP